MQSYNMTIINRYLIDYGSKAVAAMGIALKVNMIIMMIMVGFAFGAQPLIGYSYGAKDNKRLQRSFASICWSKSAFQRLPLFLSSFLHRI